MNAETQTTPAAATTSVASSSEFLENTTYDEIRVGNSARLTRTLKIEDIRAFAAVSGDINPAHMDAEFAGASVFHGVIGHGMWSAALISTILGTIYPGPGTIYYNQSLKFRRPVMVGDTVTVVITVTSKQDEKKLVVFDCLVTNQHNDTVVKGEAVVVAPQRKIRSRRASMPQIHLFDPEERLNNMLSLRSDLSPVPCGVVHPTDKEAIRGPVRAAQRGLIDPIFIGVESKMREVAEHSGIDLSPFKIIPTAHSHEAADRAAEMAANGELECLMKGSLHTDELLHSVLGQRALRTKYRLSHIFRLEAPLYRKPLYISDAAINISPTLMEKADIVQNAINLTRILGVERPKVALLSALETVTPALPSTLDAAALCKMADRGQIKGGELDGPLAFDNAISTEAANIKHIHSNVTGNADVLIVPDLVSGNIMSKQMEYLSGAMTCGIVMGCAVPIALTSRADGSASRLASALLAKLVAHYYRHHKP